MRKQLSTAPRPQYLGTAAVGAWFGVSARTVGKWLERYDDFPSPDVVIEGEGVRETVGWAPEREAEWRAWHTARRGQGWRRGKFAPWTSNSTGHTSG